MMNKKKITVLVNKSVGIDNYISFLSEKYNIEVLDYNQYESQEIDLVLFTGGEDVSPYLYNENKGKFTGINKTRDEREANYMFYPRHLENVPKLGICRGAQFLTVMNGGSLVQHVTGHAIGKLHAINIAGPFNTTVEITSTHHQMMFPYNLSKDKYEILGTSYNFLSNTYLNGNDTEKELPIDFQECEIVYYKGSKSLCIQGHPEMANCPEETKNICLDMIDYYLKV